MAAKVILGGGRVTKIDLTKAQCAELANYLRGVLKDAIARRDKQIADMNQGMAQLAKAVAVKEEKDNG